MVDTEEYLDSLVSSEEAMALEDRYGAHNYKPQPVVLSKGEGVFVWDPEGNRYFDFLAAYSALNQGHCHPKIVETAKAQLDELTLTSRAFYNNWLGKAEQYLSETFGFDKALFMNSGAEAVETAIKLARKWGYYEKEMPEDKAKIVVVEGNFHGRTVNVISFSTSEDAKEGFGPFNPGYHIIPYNDAKSLDQLAADPEVCAFLVEPIQGEAGAVVPDAGYLKQVREICDRHNILFIADEIQTGLGRTGKMLACDHEDVKPDVLILGKALSAGILPVSAVLANDDVMLKIQPGEHGSTFGGNPFGARVCIEAVKVIQEENLCANAEEMGKIFREKVRNMNSPLIKEVRGKGLLNAVVIDDKKAGLSAKEICIKMKENGLLAKQTHGNVIRFTPPLIINREQLEEGCAIIEKTLRQIAES